MHYSIWTDGSSSVERNSASSEYLIFSDKTYIGSSGTKFDESKSSTYAEAVAIGLSLASVFPKLKEGDTVSIHTDSIHCYKALSSIIANVKNYYSGFSGIKKSQYFIRRGSEMGVSFSVFKVKAHKNTTLTPNRIVDLLARRRMRC